MPEEKIKIRETDYYPVNQYIDEQSAIRRSRSFWGYAKSIALLLVALGIMAILIAYAFYLYKKKDYLVRVDQVRQEAFTNGVASSKDQIGQLEAKIQNLESIDKSNKSTIDSIKSRNQTLESDYQKLQDDFSKSREEVAKIRTDMLENKEVKFYQKELQKIKDKAVQNNSSLQTNLILFLDERHTLPNGKQVEVKTRWYFKDPSQEKPDLKNCYIDFQTSDLRALELGEKGSDFNYAKYYSDRLNLDKTVFVDIKNSKCNF